MTELNQTRQLLLMAAAVLDLGPELGAHAPRANAFKVIRQALHWAGLYSGDVRASFERYGETPEIAEFYDALTSMMPQGDANEPLFEGAGNLSETPRASPFFTHCRLTEIGAVTATELLSKNPAVRDNLWQPGSA